MSEYIIRAIIPAIILLLIIWLIYRIKKHLRMMIRDQIYGNFPAIKDKIDNFERRIDYLKTQIEVLERKIKELNK